MSTHLMRTLAFGIDGDAADEALHRILARRVLSSPASRTVGQGERDGRRGWRLDISARDDVAWDPSLACELSAELGSFVVSAEASRALGRCGFAVFFAGRGLEFFRREADGHRFAEPDPNPSAIKVPDDIYPAAADIYFRLTGFPMIGPSRPWRGHASTLTMTEPQLEPCDSPNRQARLALAIFALAGAPELNRVRGEIGDARLAGWRRQTAQTEAGVPYLVLARDGDLDAALCLEIGQLLDVPATAVAFRSRSEPFQWWARQPGHAPSHGVGSGAASFIDRLAPATAAFGEMPGIITV